MCVPHENMTALVIIFIREHYSEIFEREVLIRTHIITPLKIIDSKVIFKSSICPDNTCQGDMNGLRYTTESTSKLDHYSHIVYVEGSNLREVL